MYFFKLCPRLKVDTLLDYPFNSNALIDFKSYIKNFLDSVFVSGLMHICSGNIHTLVLTTSL